MINHPRIIHTMIRVGDLEKSINFYQNLLGMTLNKKTEYPNGEFTLAFLGYGSIATHPQIELTYNWGVDKYEIGTGFGHLALEVSDIYQYCDTLKKQGVEVTREPGKMKHSDTVIAFIKDPDGYLIEFIQK